MANKISESNRFKPATRDVINLVLKNAHNTSERSGVGWALLDMEGKLLTHGSIMAGIEVKRPAIAVARFKDRLHHLILSTEPVPGLLAAETLIASLDASACVEITVCHRLDDDVADPLWREWLTNWNGHVDFSISSGTAQSLVAGIIKVRRQNRPWVTAMCAASLENRSLPLIRLIDEFGFKAYFKDLIQKSRAHLIESFQREILEHLPEENKMDELVEVYEVSDVALVKTILKFAASEKRCNVVLSCGLKLLADLIEEDLVDEIIHHIAISSGHDLDHAMTHSYNLEKWHLIASNSVGNCTRIQLQKKEDIERQHPSSLTAIHHD